MTDYPAYVGIDPSLTSTGRAVHWLNPEMTDLQRIRSTGSKDATWSERGRRIIDIAMQATRGIPEHSLVVMESPSYGSVGGAQHDRSGLWWQIHNNLRRLECTIVAAAPSQRMKYITGTGRADKDKVLAAAIRRYPHLDITGNDIADAVIFMAMAARLAGHPLEDSSPATMTDVVAKLSTQIPEGTLV